MKLLVDMNLSPRWVDVLATAGFEAAHWSTLGANNAPDAEIMAYARAHDYVVLTHDLHFSPSPPRPTARSRVSCKSAPRMSART
jgi:predicted nuclease of predicted toxin-antitoxin system